MFGIKRERLIKNLTTIRDRICAYGDHFPCDCKYGTENEEWHQLQENFSGCPELSMCIEILSAMNEEDFSEWCKKANIIGGFGL